jgi:hypothetical protein
VERRTGSAPTLIVAAVDEPGRRRLVGVPGFEPGAFRSQSGRAAKLRHTPLDPDVVTEDSRRSLPVKGTPCTARPAPADRLALRTTARIMVGPPG